VKNLTQKLYVFVEGKDDERLIRIVMQKCYPQYAPTFFRYIHTQSALIRDYVDRLRTNNDLYVLFTDKDHFICNITRKQNRINEYGVEEERIIIVNTSIESWYAAGAKTSVFNSQGNRSETINKQRFNQLIGRAAHHTRVMENIVESFNTNNAIQKNNSFKYFYRKLQQLLGNNATP